MKKRIIFCFLLFISCLLSCNSHNGKSKSEKLTSAIENDCEQLKQYLSNCAIDISYAIDDGLNIDEVINNIKNSYVKYTEKLLKSENLMPNERGIYEKAFAYAVTSELGKLPNKNSSSFLVSENVRYNFFKNIFIFVSDIFFEKIGSDYFVYESNNDKVLNGMIYKGDEKNLVFTIKDGHKLYRFVQFSAYQIETAELILRELTVEIPVYIDIYKLDNYVNIDYSFKDKTLYARIDSFYPASSDINIYMKKLNEICANLGSSNNVILDLRENIGGINDYFLPILYTLLFGENYQNNETECKAIQSQIDFGVNILNTELIRKQINQNGDYWEYGSENPDEKIISQEYDENSIIKYTPKYKGKVYVLMNKNTELEAELFIAMLKYYFGENCITIGHNSFGFYDYKAPFSYLLDDSKIKIYLSCYDYCQNYYFKNSQWHGDTEGFSPDYWIFSDYNIDAKDIISYIESL